MIAILLVPLLLFSPVPGYHDTDELLARAAAAYQGGLQARDDSNKARTKFLRAAEAYEQAWKAGRHTPDVANNMAQARFLAGDLGRCIRDYRRGLRVAPFDPELRRGLAFAREQVAYPVVGDLEKAARPRMVESPLARVGISPLQLSVGTILLWLVGWVCLARAWMLRRGIIALIGVACLITATCLGVSIAWEEKRNRDQSSVATAIVESGTVLRLGNSDEYPRRLDGLLPAGVELHVLGLRGGWLHVELADGTAGWVLKDQIVLVD